MDKLQGNSNKKTERDRDDWIKKWNLKRRKLSLKALWRLRASSRMANLSGGFFMFILERREILISFVAKLIGEVNLIGE